MCWNTIALTADQRSHLDGMGSISAYHRVIAVFVGAQNRMRIVMLTGQQAVQIGRRRPQVRAGELVGPRHFRHSLRATSTIAPNVPWRATNESDKGEWVEEAARSVGRCVYAGTGDASLVNRPNPDLTWPRIQQEARKIVDSALNASTEASN